MANLSQKKRQRMLAFLDTIRQEHKNDDDVLTAINEIENELTTKKYGLVWERHEEAVDVQMREKIPVFTECEDKEISTVPGENYNFLLEGDNLHSLRLLEKTHRGKIDVIYIDPPYNTGSRDFVYDDNIVVKEDGYRHSKWLSFMKARLCIARELLSEKGVIFISIDDYEQAQLKLLCDEIFENTNFRGQIVRGTGTPTGQGNATIANEIDYVLVYARTERAEFNGLPFESEDAKIYNLSDEYGKYLLRPLRKTGNEDRREDRPTMYYPIIAPDGKKVYPIGPTGYKSRWRCQKDTFDQFQEAHRIEWKKVDGSWKVYLKFYLEGRTKQPGNLWIGIEGNKKATLTIKEIFGSNAFSFPKPVELITRILQISGNSESTILDFFAGSGTTGHAVLKQNAADGGNRHFILCTNNENNICEEVTYERLKRVITGYGSAEGIPANLKYFRTDFVPKDSENLTEELLEHIQEMVELEHCIKLDGREYLIVLSDEELDDLAENWDKYPEAKALYVSKNVLFTTKQRELFNNIEIHVIPDYYFKFEMQEADEAW